MPWKPCKERSEVHRPETAYSGNDAAIRSGREPCLSEKMKPADESRSEFDKSARDYEALFKPWLKIAGSFARVFCALQTELAVLSSA